MRRSRIRAEEEYDSGEYESGEYESGDYESAEYQAPYPRRSSSAAVLAIGGIALAFLGVFMAYYFLIYKPEQTPLVLPERKGGAEVEVEKGPDYEGVYEELERFAVEHADDHAAVIESFEKGTENLKGSPYEEKARSRAEEVLAKWDKLAGEAFGEAKEKSEELFQQGDFDGAVAAMKAIPEKLLPRVEEKMEQGVAALEASAKERVDAVFDAAEDLLAGGDFEKALAMMDKASLVKYAAVAEEIAEKSEAFKNKVAGARQALRDAKERKIKARLDSYLADFDLLLAQGKFKDARSKARDAIEAEKGKGKEKADSIVEAMEGAAELAGILLERATAVRNAKADWSGKKVILKTSAGEKKGTIRKFGDEEIEIEVEFRMQNVVGSRPETIKISDLAAGEVERLLPAPASTRPIEWLADVVTALGRGKTDSAKEALGKAEGHVLSGHYAERIEVKTLGAPEAAATKYWRDRLASLAAKDELSAADAAAASRALSEFEEAHGTSEFAKTVGTDIAELKEKVKKALPVGEAPEAGEKPEEAGEKPGAAPGEAGVKGYSALWGRVDPKALKPGGEEGELPFVRANPGVAYDSKRGLSILYGGDGMRINDLWAYDAESNTWRCIQECKENAAGISRPAGMPSMRNMIPFAYDQATDRYLLFQGKRGRPPYALWAFDPESRLWAKKFDSNQEIELVAMSSTGRSAKLAGIARAEDGTVSAFLFDESGTFTKKTSSLMSGKRHEASFMSPGSFVPDGSGKYLLFGGMVGKGAEDDLAPVGDTWLFDPIAGVSRELQPAKSPTPRSGASVCYHSKLGVWVLFGGDGVAGENTGVRLNDTWVYQPVANTWVQARTPFRSPPGSQPGRRALWYDSKKDECVLLIAAYGAVCQTWRLQLKTLTAKELEKLNAEEAKKEALKEEPKPADPVP
jgi:hypothetical protein